MALRALTEYAKMDTNRAIYNIEFTVMATSMGNFTDIVHIKRGNWADQDYVNVCTLFYYTVHLDVLNARVYDRVLCL